MSTRQRVSRSSTSPSGTLARKKSSKGRQERPRPVQGRAGGTADKSKRKTCKALTTTGAPCRKSPVPGLNVCRSHGGATAASAKSARRRRVESRVAGLWGVAEVGDGVSVEGELQRLARNKLTDVTALRIELGSNPDKYYGMLVESKTDEQFAIDGTVQSKYGSQSKVIRRSGVHPLVEELHKAEQELITILRLLQEVSGGTTDEDIQRIKMQTARETARLLKAFPGISVDNVALEVAKRGS